jgi:nucleoid-associated protein YgaU
MARHPSSKRPKAPVHAPKELHRKHHVVAAGDDLWSIAAQALETDDIRRIARYWPKLHRQNREVIGSNPQLIRPGQVLTFPAER